MDHGTPHLCSGGLLSLRSAHDAPRGAIGSVCGPPHVSQSRATGTGPPESVARRPLKGAELLTDEPLVQHSDPDEAIDKLIATSATSRARPAAGCGGATATGTRPAPSQAAAWSGRRVSGSGEPVRGSTAAQQVVVANLIPGWMVGPRRSTSNLFCAAGKTAGHRLPGGPAPRAHDRPACAVDAGALAGPPGCAGCSANAASRSRRDMLALSGAGK